MSLTCCHHLSKKPCKKILFYDTGSVTAAFATAICFIKTFATLAVVSAVAFTIDYRICNLVDRDNDAVVCWLFRIFVD